MAGLSNYLENALVNDILRTTAFTPPATHYVALYTSDPTDANSGTEVSGGAYARVAVTKADASWDAPSDGATANTSAITFPAPSGANWGTVTHFGILDAASTGNLLFHGALTSSQIVNDGDPAPVFNAGALTITFA